MIRRPPKSTLFPSTTLSRSRPKKSDSIPAEKKHIGVSALPGSASTQSSLSSVSAAVPSGAAVTVPQPCAWRSEEHTSELQSRLHLVCRLLLEKKKQYNQ